MVGLVGRSVVVVGLIVTGALGLGAGVATAVPDPPWTVIALQPLTPTEQTMVFDINAAGTSVGWSDSRPVRWNPAGVPTALAYPAVGCTTGSANAIADSGIAVGIVQCPGQQNLGIMWLADGTPVPIETGMSPRDVTDAGLVVGDKFPPNGNFFQAAPFAFVRGQPRKDLSMAGAASAGVAAVTSYGYAVGSISDANANGPPKTAAVGWLGDQVFPLLLTTERTWAAAVTESGYALVDLDPASGTGSQGFLVAPGGLTAAFGHPGLNDYLYDLNENGVAIGISQLGPEGPYVGAFYFPGGSLRFDTLASASDVSTYGLDEPQAVNDAGWVVGATDHDHFRAWLLRPPS